MKQIVTVILSLKQNTFFDELENDDELQLHCDYLYTWTSAYGYAQNKEIEDTELFVLWFSFPSMAHLVWTIPNALYSLFLTGISGMLHN